jgi:succinate dehydrogenase / fumarate reductase iron-sulfur subunit
MGNGDSTSRTIRVRRTGGELEEFRVTAGRYRSLLDGLEEIRGNTDRSLLYRHSCHHGSCGTCAVIVNGERKLACTTLLVELPEGAVVEPLAPFQVLGDLAVDPAELYADFPDDAGYLRPSEVNRDAAVPAEISGEGRDGFQRFENCIECGICVSVCPVTRDFMGPAALAAYGRELEKHPEREAELLPGIDHESGVWGCDRALRCSQACPLGVAPGRHIAVLQRTIKARRGD